MTQLKQLPMPFYPLSPQEEFVVVARRIELLRGKMAESTRQVEGLFESLLASVLERKMNSVLELPLLGVGLRSRRHKAFKGEL